MKQCKFCNSKLSKSRTSSCAVAYSNCKKCGTSFWIYENELDSMTLHVNEYTVDIDYHYHCTEISKRGEHILTLLFPLENVNLDTIVDRIEKLMLFT